ncbi:MAG: hypothetical protein IKZ00_00925 [Bacteroidaceae bacterium]|nr:hypothetical protein [Bacteroidaceae bacterium]
MSCTKEGNIIEKWLAFIEYDNWIYWVAGFFALLEFFRWAYGGVEWVFKTFGIETKRMRAQREWQERLTKTEAAIVEIKHTSEKNVNLFLEHEKAVVEKFTGIKDDIVEELGKLHAKLDEQKEEFERTKMANCKTDRAVLRDRIASGMRFFSQNRDEDGNVHIKFSDYENLEDLYQEYFKKGGNGAFKRMYESEFQSFIIDP